MAIDPSKLGPSGNPYRPGTVEYFKYAGLTDVRKATGLGAALKGAANGPLGAIATTAIDGATGGAFSKLGGFKAVSAVGRAATGDTSAAKRLAVKQAESALGSALPGAPVAWGAGNSDSAGAAIKATTKASKPADLAAGASVDGKPAVGASTGGIIGAILRLIRGR